MGKILELVRSYLSNKFYIPVIRIIDIVEILIFAAIIYFFIAWIKKTRAYTLLKGIVFVLVFVGIAYFLQMSAILWLTERVASVATIAVVIIFQPELRKALESLGNREFFSGFFLFDNGRRNENMFSDRTISEVLRSVSEMSETRTGALIVLERNILLDEYINTGIELDSVVSSQLMTNIFEHNTPLHDGAVIVREDKISAATCYLPLSDNATISKKFGTRHRAALGISEVSDSFTIIVSEETGRISFAYLGELTTGVSTNEIRELLHRIQKRKGVRTQQDRHFRLKEGGRNRAH